MTVSRVHKIKCLTQAYQMGYSGSGSGLRWGLRDGFLHEVGHMVCLGITAKEFARAKHPHVGVELFVANKLRRFVQAGGNSDNDECRTIAACVHALRQIRMMQNTKAYVRSSLALAHDLMDNPKTAAKKVQRSLATKVAVERGRKILEFVDELYEIKTKGKSIPRQP